MSDLVWAFDVDGCLIDALTGGSLRPLARTVLERLHASGVTVVLWSAGGGAYARRRAEAHGIDDLVTAFYDKDERDGDGCYVLTHLADAHCPDVCVDDQPEELPSHVDRVAVRPYLSHDPHDRGLAPILDRITS